MCTPSMLMPSSKSNNSVFPELMEMAQSLVMIALVMPLELLLVMMASLVMEPVPAKLVLVVLTAQNNAPVVPMLFATMSMELANVLKASMVLPVPLVIALIHHPSPIDVMIGCLDLENASCSPTLLMLSHPSCFL